MLYSYFVLLAEHNVVVASFPGSLSSFFSHVVTRLMLLLYIALLSGEGKGMRLATVFSFPPQPLHEYEPEQDFNTGRGTVLQVLQINYYQRLL